MLRQDAYCTVYYGQNSYTIPLPDTTQVDCHIYLKEQLAQQGVKALCNKDIQVVIASQAGKAARILRKAHNSQKAAVQVEAGSSFGLLRSDAKLRRGSYRVTQQTDLEELSGMLYASWLSLPQRFKSLARRNVSVAAGSVVAVKWAPVFHVRHMSLLGYFPQVIFGSVAAAEQQQATSSCNAAMPVYNNWTSDRSACRTIKPLKPSICSWQQTKTDVWNTWKGEWQLMSHF